MEIILSKKIMKAHEDAARAIRERLNTLGCLAVNLVGSPGAGKTALLEAALPLLAGKTRVAVIEGDMFTANDARRIEARGARAVQINTEGACHLDANAVEHALRALDPREIDILFIENVGNLICTAGFDLGEQIRVAVLSVAEGDDKIEKYPPIFRGSHAVALNKLDLLPYTDFQIDRAREQLNRIAPDAKVFELSARTGEGIEAWVEWLLDERGRLLR